jgi:hypothetical protein
MANSLLRLGGLIPYMTCHLSCCCLHPTFVQIFKLSEPKLSETRCLKTGSFEKLYASFPDCFDRFVADVCHTGLGAE